jgi:hypothetical protein
MKYFRFIRSLLLALLLGFSFPNCGHDHGADVHIEDPDGTEQEEDESEESRNFGPDMAVLAADEESGIELAEAAVKRLEVEFAPLRSFRTADSNNEFSIPFAALILFEDAAQVFIRSEKRIRPIRVRIVDQSEARIRIRIAEESFRSTTHTEQAELVVEQAGFVRLAYLEAFGASGSGDGD